MVVVLTDGFADELILAGHALLDDGVKLWVDDGLDDVLLECGLVLLVAAILY